MVQSLGNLLRITLNSTSFESTIESELKLVNAYIAIQQIRFDERLIFSTEIEDCFFNPRTKTGLQNINEQFKLTFGNDFGLMIYNKKLK